MLDLAYRWVHPDARIDLDTVHRFVHTVSGHTIPDSDYAQLTLATRADDDPGAVFDALHARGHIAVHGSQVQRCDALADHLVATRLGGGGTATVVVDTREHAAVLNAAIRDRLVAAGAVDDRRVAVTHDGQRLGAGDVIVTRRNDHDLGVANREVWTVTRVHPTGRLTVDDSERGGRELPADYAAAGYVAMTRGRQANIAHLVAADLDDAREQWIAAFGRDRADLGPAAAGTNAASRLPELTERVEVAQHRVRSADQLIERLTTDPAINSHPDPWVLLQQAKTGWVTEQAAAHRQAASRESGPVQSLRNDPSPTHQVDHGRSLGL